MTPSRARILVSVGFLLAAGGAHSAQLARTSIVAPGVMSSTCAGLTNGASPAPGDLVNTGFPAELTCNSQQSAGATASSSASYANAGQAVSGASRSFAAMGAMRLESDFSGPNSATFPQAVATAGWVDGWRVDPTNPALIGQNAVLSFRLHVTGDLLAIAGFNSVARLAATPYVNDLSVSTPTNVSFQGQGQQGSPYQQTVDATVGFAVPIVLGTPFELGLFGRAASGTASVAGSNLINTVSSDAPSIDWEGITSVTVGGQPVDVVVTSTSGVDWTVPVPEPALGFGIVCGMAGLAALGARRSSRSSR